MEILFANSQIEKVCTSEPAAIKKLDARCAEILLRRLRQMRDAKDLETLTRIPGITTRSPQTVRGNGLVDCKAASGSSLSPALAERW